MDNEKSKNNLEKYQNYMKNLKNKCTYRNLVDLDMTAPKEAILEYVLDNGLYVYVEADDTTVVTTGGFKWGGYYSPRIVMYGSSQEDYQGTFNPIPEGTVAIETDFESVICFQDGIGIVPWYDEMPHPVLLDSKKMGLNIADLFEYFENNEFSEDSYAYESHKKVISEVMELRDKFLEMARDEKDENATTKTEDELKEELISQIKQAQEEGRRLNNEIRDVNRQNEEGKGEL